MTERTDRRPERPADLGRAAGPLVMLLVFVALPVAAGLLAFIGAISDGDGAADGLAGASAVACSADGRQVYVTAWDDNCLTVFNVDSETGELVHARTFEDNSGGIDGLANPLGVAASPDGHHVYVASFGDNAVAIFRRIPETGVPTHLHYRGTLRDGDDEVFWLGGASDVAVSPSGREVYVISWVDQSLMVFHRDAGGDRLQLVDVENEASGAPALAGAAAVAVSPDGRNVYVACSLVSAVMIFARDATRDGVAFAGMVQDGLDGTDGLAGTRHVLVDSSGEYVYASGGGENAVAIFSRDTTTDDLAFVDRIKDGIDGVEGIGGARGLAELPSQRLVLVAGREVGAVSLFRRDLTTGLLSFEESYHDGVGGAMGLAGVADLAVNQVYGDLYSVSIDADAVAAFDFVDTIFADGFDRGNTSAWTMTVP